MPATGRFAPSPSGALHLGNLRTAALAWLRARSTESAFLLRIEDLDAQRCRPEHEDGQIADLQAIGLTWDGVPARQSTRLSVYRQALEDLIAAGHTYECYCSRKDIRDAQSAPHADAGRYPGTCRALTDTQRAQRRAHAERPPAIRLRGGDASKEWHDLVRGTQQQGVADDVVLCRWDGALAYNLAVVVDDIWQGVSEVIRGDDLIDQTATQLLLAELLTAATPSIAYGHVPLVLNGIGKRLAKRDGAVTLDDLAAQDIGAGDATALLLRSLGPAVSPDVRTLDEAVVGFDLAALSPDPWIYAP